VPGVARADASPEVAVGVGTSGVSGTVAVPLGSFFDVRVGGGGLKIDGVNYTTGEFVLDGAFSEGDAKAVLDWHPARGYFAVEGGLAVQNFRVAGTGFSREGVYDFNGDLYPLYAVGKINGLVKFATEAPYLGIGGVPVFHRGVGIGYDLGALYQGSPDVTLAATGPIRNNPRFQRDLAAETSAVAFDATERLYPVIDLYLTFRP
jgi:hypothetical protein